MKAKKIISLLVAASLSVMAFTGCSFKGSENKTESNTDTIKLGFINDISGEYALTGPRYAAELAVSEINAAGGILGKQVELIAVDGQSDTQRDQEMAKQLVLEENVSAVILEGNSAAREAVRSIFEDNNNLFFYCSMYEGGVASKNTFCTGCTPEQQLETLIRYYSENSSFGKNIYIVANDYNYGQICAEWVKVYAEQYGMNICGEEYVPVGTTEFSSSISKIQSANADIVFTLVSGPSVSFYDQWSTAELENITLCGGTLFAFYEHITYASPVLDGAYSCMPYCEELGTPESEEFVTKMKTAYPEEVYITSEDLLTYNTVYLWKAAVEAAGTAEPEAVISALENNNISIEGPTGTVTMDGASHHLAMNMYLLQCDESHTLNIIDTNELVQPSYLQSLNVDLRKDAPNEQFSPLN